MSNNVECPVCQVSFASSVILAHVNSCLNDHEEHEDHSKEKTRKRQSDTGWEFLTSSKSTKISDRPRPQSKTPSLVNTTQKRSLLDAKNVLTKAKSGSHDTYIIDSDNESESESFANISDRNKNVEKKSKSPDCQEASTSSFFKASSKAKSKQSRESNIPLAAKMRPNDLECFIGQNQAVKKKSLLYNIMSHMENVPSMIFWGPPGCGKTTLANIVGTKSKENGRSKFVSMSATSASVNDVKQLANLAMNDMKMLRRKTILFLDEIHRFNKLQQDTLLPYVENGTLTLIGATTENPSFHVNSALLSRCRVIVLEKLSVEDIKTILKRALVHLGVSIKISENDLLGAETSKDADEESRLVREENRPCPPVTMEVEALDFLAGLTDGDARSALNGLQMAWEGCLAQANGEGEERTYAANITVDIIKEALQRSHVLYDRTGEEHFNTVSAMIKSLRGSDADAALYWMVRMLEGGENPLFVARRLVVFASEDVGLADPHALSQAVSTHQACQILGMPECAINLTHCAIYLARAPKSTCVMQALIAARSCIREHQGPLPPVPLHLRNASTKLMADLGYGKGYKYYDESGKQDYLPPSLKGTKFVPS